MRDDCGRVIAFVLALGTEAGDIGGAILAARQARVAGVFVLARPEFAEAAVEAVRTSGRKGQTMVQAVEYDPPAGGAAELELPGRLSPELLETMRVISESALDDYDAVLVADAAECSIAEGDIRGLCLAASEQPDADAVAALVDGERRLPCLVMRPFLDRLEAHGSDFSASACDMPIRVCGCEFDG